MCTYLNLSPWTLLLLLGSNKLWLKLDAEREKLVADIVPSDGSDSNQNSSSSPNQSVAGSITESAEIVSAPANSEENP